MNIFADWKREGRTVYALNEDGTNIFSAHVQFGFKRQEPGKTGTVIRLAEDEAEQIARLIASAPDIKRQRDQLLAALMVARPTVLRSLEMAEDPWLRETRHAILNQVDDAIAACEEPKP